jgi:cytochrome c
MPYDLAHRAASPKMRTENYMRATSIGHAMFGSASIIAALLSLSACGQASEKAPSPAEIAAGKTLFATQCATCHSATAGEPARVGPNLHGIVGRESASAAFEYSPAMANAHIRWTPSALREFLKDPAAKVPGTAMQFPGLPNEQDRKAVVAYLQSGAR